MAKFDELTFTAAERALIQSAFDANGNCDWDLADLGSVRLKIKEHFLSVTEELCAYCQRSFHGEFKLVIDVEHILPKNDFPSLAFTPINLTVSCKRCNMNVKRAKWNFVHNRSLLEVLTGHDKSGSYEIAHPNLDIADDHIVLFSVQRGAARALFYRVANNSMKGATTYSFFKLRELEIEALDLAQGLPVSESTISDAVNALFGKT